jgi:hypothetical protein
VLQLGRIGHMVIKTGQSYEMGYYMFRGGEPCMELHGSPFGEDSEFCVNLVWFPDNPCSNYTGYLTHVASVCS